MFVTFQVFSWILGVRTSETEDKGAPKSRMGENQREKIGAYQINPVFHKKTLVGVCWIGLENWNPKCEGWAKSMMNVAVERQERPILSICLKGPPVWKVWKSVSRIEVSSCWQQHATGWNSFLSLLSFGQHLKKCFCWCVGLRPISHHEILLRVWRKC